MPASTLSSSARSALATAADLHEACADPTRLRLLNLLAGGELCVCDLVDLTQDSQPLVSRHLARLRAAGLVAVERRSKFAYYRLADLPSHHQRQLDAILDGLIAADSRLKAERKAAASSAAKRGAIPCE
jgi:ArsR family transcriptional regulator